MSESEIALPNDFQASSSGFYSYHSPEDEPGNIASICAFCRIKAVFDHQCAVDLASESDRNLPGVAKNSRKSETEIVEEH